MSLFDPNDRTLPQWIKHLNLIAEVLQDNTDLHSVDLIDRTAAESNLTLIRERGRKRIYKTPNGIFINAWIDGEVSGIVEPGGIGFDDQVYWLHDQ